MTIGPRTRVPQIAPVASATAGRAEEPASRRSAMRFSSASGRTACGRLARSRPLAQSGDWRCGRSPRRSTVGRERDREQPARSCRWRPAALGLVEDHRGHPGPAVDREDRDASGAGPAAAARGRWDASLGRTSLPKQRPPPAVGHTPPLAALRAGRRAAPCRHDAVDPRVKPAAKAAGAACERSSNPRRNAVQRSTRPLQAVLWPGLGRFDAFDTNGEGV